MAKTQSASRRQRLAAVAETILEEHRRRYVEYGDPFHVWEAYREARAVRTLGVEIPAWVLQYLDEAAAAIVAIAHDVVLRVDESGSVTPQYRETRPRPFGRRVLAALKMSKAGAGSPHSQRLTRRRDAALADAVARRLEQKRRSAGPGEKPTERAAIKFVAKGAHISIPTVGRAYRAMKAKGRLATV